MKEIWKESTTYPRYWASDSGRIRGPSGNILEGSESNAERRKIRVFFEDGKSVWVMNYWIVADAWLGSRPENYTVDHIDGNCLNNRPNNLEYVTHAENVKRSHRFPRKYRRSETFTDEDALDILLKVAKGVPQHLVAQQYAVKREAISELVTGKRMPKLGDRAQELRDMIDVEYNHGARISKSAMKQAVIDVLFNKHSRENVAEKYATDKTNLGHVIIGKSRPEIIKEIRDEYGDDIVDQAILDSRTKKLSKQDKQNILEKLSQGWTGAALAREYNISTARISAIKNEQPRRT